jgi:redox-sensitive bicupin YhaK (pirin superfamily)
LHFLAAQDGFSMRRALPHGRRQMVGPFIFFDQMGPVQFIAESRLSLWKFACHPANAGG